MLDRIQVVALAGSVLLLLLVLELVRRRRLAEEYSALWIVSAVLLIGLSLRRDLRRLRGALAGRLLSSGNPRVDAGRNHFRRVALLLGDSVASTAADQPADRGERHHGGRIARSSPRPRHDAWTGGRQISSRIDRVSAVPASEIVPDAAERSAQRGQAVNRRAPSPRTQDSGS